MAQFEAELMALEFTGLRLMSANQRGRVPGIEASVLKVRGTELRQAIYELLVEVAGPDAVPFEERAMTLEGAERLRQRAGPGVARGELLRLAQVVDLRRRQRSAAQPDRSRRARLRTNDMDFSLNDEHVALQDAVRRFCDGEYPAHERGNPETAEAASRRWAGMAELGLLGLPFDAELGGSEQGAVELMLVAEELGRSLGGGAWLSCVVLAGQLLAEAGTPAQCSAWLPKIASGQQAARAGVRRGRIALRR